MLLDELLLLDDDERNVRQPELAADLDLGALQDFNQAIQWKMIGIL